MLIPKTSLKQLFAILQIACFGAILAGCYGIVHDQITYSIGPSYFTKFKFEQFQAVDFGLHNRIFTSIIGFLATWWVGLIIGWIIARLSITEAILRAEKRRAIKAIICVIAATIASGFIAWGLAELSHGPENLAFWQSMNVELTEEEVPSFRTVGYIHNGGYVGAALSTVIIGVFLLVANRRKGEGN